MNTFRKPLISVIIPVYNEYDAIPFLVDGLNEFFGNSDSLSGEVIFVNDGSRDQSSRRLCQMRHQNYRARVLNLSRNFGSHAALRAGIAQASGDLICFNYADLQDPLDLIHDMAAGIAAGHDIVWAHRETTAVSRSERLFSRMYASLMRRFAFADFPENGFDIVMFNRKVADQINRNVEANSSVFLQILALGFRQSAITYRKRERKIGASKWTLAKKMKLFVDSFVAFSFAPIRMVSVIGILMFVLGIGWTIYIIFRKLLFDDLASGWPAMISILMVGFGITNISLGILAEYLWRTLDASRNRPVYVIDEILDPAAEKSTVAPTALLQT